jgi:hypothetical protein
MLQKRLLLQAQWELAFSDKSVKQIAGQLGYNDPAYFNRYFSVQLQTSPLEFRKEFDYTVTDTFVQNLLQLIGQYHKTEHSTSFYADKMFMSIKTLIVKCRKSFPVHPGNSYGWNYLTVPKIYYSKTFR